MLTLGKLPSGLLQSLLNHLPTLGPEIIVPPGVGRDAAGIKIGKKFFAVTTDPITCVTSHLATYSVYVNMNDIACLGCVPRWYTGVLLLPPKTHAATVKKIWNELAQVLRQNNVQAIGGHVEVTNAVTRPVLIGQMIGEALYGKLLDPVKIKPGDCLLMWQKLALEGTAVIAQEKKEKLKKYFSLSAINRMSNLLSNPGINIYPFAKKLLTFTREIVALHDPTEGGVVTAIHELADAAQCGVKADCSQFSFLPETLKLAEIFHFNPLGLLASGSLLIVCREAIALKILQHFLREPLTLLGSFIPKNKGKILVKNGKIRNLPRFDQDEIVKIL